MNERTGHSCAEASQDAPHATESDESAHEADRTPNAPRANVRGRTAARAVIDASVSEAEWQRQVEELAERCGFVWFHDADSRRNRAGFPDLTLCHMARGILLFIELKTARGRLRPDQQRWGDAEVTA